MKTPIQENTEITKKTLKDLEKRLFIVTAENLKLLDKIKLNQRAEDLRAQYVHILNTEGLEENLNSDAKDITTLVKLAYRLGQDDCMYRVQVERDNNFTYYKKLGLIFQTKEAAEAKLKEIMSK